MYIYAAISDLRSKTKAKQSQNCTTQLIIVKIAAIGLAAVAQIFTVDHVDAEAVTIVSNWREWTVCKIFWHIVLSLELERLCAVSPFSVWHSFVFDSIVLIPIKIMQYKMKLGRLSRHARRPNRHHRRLHRMCWLLLGSILHHHLLRQFCWAWLLLGRLPWLQ